MKPRPQKRVGFKEKQYSAKIDYSRADWSKSDIHIALQLGIAKVTAAAERKRRGLPPVKDPHFLGGFTNSNKARQKRLALTDDEPIGFSEYGVEE